MTRRTAISKIEMPAASQSIKASNFAPTGYQQSQEFQNYRSYQVTMPREFMPLMPGNSPETVSKQHARKLDNSGGAPQTQLDLFGNSKI